MRRKETAAEYFRQGYNCSQAVVLAFKDEIGLDEEVLARMSVGLGGGVGRMREVCGAVSGMAIVIGYLKGDGTPDARNAVYPVAQEACRQFKELNGSIVCRELLAGVPVTTGGTAEPRTEEFYKKRPCAQLVEIAVETVEKVLGI